MKKYWIFVVVTYSLLAYWADVEFSIFLYSMFALCYFFLHQEKDMYMLRIICYITFMFHLTDLFGKFDNNHYSKELVTEKYSFFKNRPKSTFDVMKNIGVVEVRADGSYGDVIMKFDNDEEETKFYDEAESRSNKSMLIRLLIIGFGFLCLILEYLMAGGKSEKVYQVIAGKCPYCFKKISTYATKCPHCTHDLPHK